MTDMELLEAAVRDTAPQPDPAFARDLERRMEAGFPRDRKRWRPSLMPALAAASVLIAVAVAGVTVLGGGKGASTNSRHAETALDKGAPLTAQSAAPTARKVERSIRLTLATGHGKLADVAARVGEVTSSHGGYVLQSNVSTGDDGARSGDFTLRIPSAQLEPALADLSGLGDVRERNESSQDLTSPFNKVQERLSNALLERRATADRLRTAQGTEAQRLRARLRALTAEVHQLNSTLSVLKRRTAMSTVNVHLEEKAAKHEGGITGGGPGAALDDALAVLAGAFNVAIRALPLALLALLAWLGLAGLRRRRREAALL